MKRVRHILFISLMVLSLLLALFFSFVIAFNWASKFAEFKLLTSRFEISVLWTERQERSDLILVISIVRDVGDAIPSKSITRGEWRGFRVESYPVLKRPGRPQQMFYEIAIPLWALLALSLSAPVIWLATYRLRIPKAGHCAICGYDMRSNPARCSECGHEPTPVAT